MSSIAPLAPLTTSFFPPAICSQVGYDSGLAYPTAHAFQGQVCHGDSFSDNAACWPTPTSVTLRAPFVGGGYYSPGLICPQGYTTACTAISQANGAAGSVTGTSFSFQYPVTAGESAIGCCPPGFDCGGVTWQVVYQTCVSTVSSGSYFIGGTCHLGTFTDFSVVSVPYSSTGASQVYDQVTLYAPLFQLNNRITPTPTSTSIKSTASKLQTSTSFTSSPVSHPGGLSTGGEAGIGVAMGLVALSLLIWLGTWLYRRRKVRESDKAYASYGQYNLQKPELAGQGLERVELDDWRLNRLELEAPYKMHEMPGVQKPTSPQELDSEQLL